MNAVGTPLTFHGVAHRQGLAARLGRQDPRLALHAGPVLPGQSGTRVEFGFLPAVIDNFSRRILAWKLADHFELGSSVAILLEAGGRVTSTNSPILLADSGVENRNGAADERVESDLLRRIRAMTEIRYSSSMIEA